MRRVIDFNACLDRSKGMAAAEDLDAIRAFFGPSCREVVPADKSMDRLGVDYVATLRRGATVYVDAKRRFNCARYWRGGVPELTLEIWSACPGGETPARVGWTLDESKLTDYVLFTWPAEEHAGRYMVPFQLLRVAFRRHVLEWSRTYRLNREQPNGGKWSSWSSTCVFVPLPVVWEAMQACAAYPQPRTHTTNTRTEYLP